MPKENKRKSETSEMASLRKIKRSKRALRRMERRRKSNKAINIIDSIPESLLLFEIFYRLRNPRYLVACKSVSKRWNSLISSSSYFHSDPSLALIVNTEPQCATNDMCLEDWIGFDLDNYVDPKFDSPACVLASCKDVLLCKKQSSNELYIVNPVTMQWSRLPTIFVNAGMKLPVGVIESGTKGLYHVARLLRHESFRLVLYVSDSERGTWFCDEVLYAPWSQSDWYPTQYQGLVFNRALHWLAHGGPVVAYNPENPSRCLFIHRSQEMGHACYGGDAVFSETLTVSMGHIRILQLVQAAGHQHLSIWTLVDYKQSTWKQEHDPISFTDLPCLQDWTSSTKHNMLSCMPVNDTTERIIFPQPLCCHPNNPLLVYFRLPESIVSLDVAKKKLQLVTRLTKRSLDEVHDHVIPMTMHMDPSLVADHGLVVRRRRKRRSNGI